jgi:hypothetical protein
MNLFEEAVALTARRIRRNDMTVDEYITSYESGCGIRLSRTTALVALQTLVDDHGYGTELRFDPETSRWHRVWFKVTP